MNNHQRALLEHIEKASSEDMHPMNRRWCYGITENVWEVQRRFIAGISVQDLFPDEYLECLAQSVLYALRYARVKKFCVKDYDMGAFVERLRKIKVGHAIIDELVKEWKQVLH